MEERRIPKEEAYSTLEEPNLEYLSNLEGTVVERAFSSGRLATKVVFDAAHEQPQRSEYDDVGVEVWLLYRASHVHLGCLVVERFNPELFEYLEAPSADVSFVKQGSLGNILSLASEEVIHDSHLARRQGGGARRTTLQQLYSGLREHRMGEVPAISGLIGPDRALLRQAAQGSVLGQAGS